MTSKARQLADLGGDTANLEDVSSAYGSGALSNRNLIINGAMQVAQRSTSVSGITTTGYNTVDRWRTAANSLGTWTQSRDSDAPDGFSSSLKMLCTTADASPASADYVTVQYRIEAQDLQSLAYGTSSAKDLTLSFWVKSNKTGTASIEFINGDNSDRSAYPSYTINAADTWEYKTVTISGDTTGGPANDNGVGLEIGFWLNSGSNFTGGSHTTSFGTFTSANRNASNLGVGGATNDYFQITGVQLEVGDTATPFEHRSYGQELALCQRYYYNSFSNGVTPNGTEVRCIYNGSSIPYAGNEIAGITTELPVTMRTRPSVVFWTANPSPNASSGRVSYYDGAWGNTSALYYHPCSSEKYVTFDLTATSTTKLTQYNIEADAEL